MKIFSRLVIVLLFTALIFVKCAEAHTQQEAFDECVGMLKDVFSQKSIQTGKDGISVACTIMPAEEIASVAWEIKNPDNKPLTIRPEDVRLYSGSREFNPVSPNEAIDILYRWTRESNTVTETQEAFRSLQIAPEEESDEELMYKSVFQFGDTDSAVISGITYFACRLRDLTNVTAEIKVNEESFKFNFGGGGP